MIISFLKNPSKKFLNYCLIYSKEKQNMAKNPEKLRDKNYHIVVKISIKTSDFFGKN